MTNVKYYFRRNLRETKARSVNLSRKLQLFGRGKRGLIIHALILHLFIMLYLKSLLFLQHISLARRSNWRLNQRRTRSSTATIEGPDGSVFFCQLRHGLRPREPRLVRI